MSNRVPVLRFFLLVLLVPFALSNLSAQEKKDEAQVDDINGAARKMRQAARSDTLPREGEPAPDFALQLLEGSSPPDAIQLDKKGRVRLSAHRGKKPVVLIFGSYTWPPFRRQAGRLEELYAKYRKDVAFYVVYIREAHAADSDWPIRSPQSVNDPRTLTERMKVATTCAKDLKLTMPMLIDEIQDTVGRKWGGFPDRMYIVGIEGRVAYRGDRGPRGFDPEEMEDFLKYTLKRGGKAPLRRRI